MKNNKIDLDKYKNEIVYSYNVEGKCSQEISKTYGVSGSTILVNLKKWGTEIRNRSDSKSIYSVNKNFFETIDSEKNAYWLGFSMADGNVIHNKFRLCLKRADEEHIMKFRNDINSNNPITRYKQGTDMSMINICNKKFCEYLVQKGCVPNKSLIVKFPPLEILGEKLTKHFIRGFLDGDGCIYLINNENRKYCSLNITSTKELLNGITEHIKNKLKIQSSPLIKRKKNNKNNYTIYYCGFQNTLSILNYLYQDSNIYLNRKFEKYLEIKELSKKINYFKPELSFGFKYPEIAKEWDETRNGTLTPFLVRCNSHVVASWKCPNNPNHVWNSPIYARTAGRTCPFCSRYNKSLGFNYPIISKEWHPTLNKNLTPNNVSKSSGIDAWWKCSNCSHEYKRKVAKQTRKDAKVRCPNCKCIIPLK